MPKDPKQHQLTRLKVIDLVDDPVTVTPDTPATRVRRIFRDTATRIVVVVDNHGRVEGVIYRSSIIMLTSAKSEARSIDLADNPPFSLEPGTRADAAIKKMLEYDEWYSPVLKDGKLVGVFGLDRVIEHGVDLLGDKLDDIRVSEYMTSEDVLVAKRDEFISSVIHKMIQHRYAGLPVVDDYGKLVGIITQYDLIRKGYTRVELESSSGPRRGAKVRNAMTYSVTYLYPWSTVREAASLMVNRGIGRIPVVDGVSTRRLIGIIDREDVVRAILGVEGL